MTPLTVLYRWCASIPQREISNPLQDLFRQILKARVINDSQIECLRKELFAEGGVDRQTINSLTSFVRQYRQMNPTLETLFFEAIKIHLLQDGTIDLEKTNWLRKVLLADSTVGASEKRLLEELHTYARRVCVEFQQLFDECMK